MSRPITNRSNYWSQHHYSLLIVLAKQVMEKFDVQFDINELINVGWFRQARYFKDVTGKAKFIQREMFNWAIAESSARLPAWVDRQNLADEYGSDREVEYESYDFSTDLKYF